MKTIISLVSIIISGIIGITLALLDFGVWSLVYLQITSALSNSIGLWFFYKWRPMLKFSVQSLKSMFSFSIWILFSSILRTVFDNIYILVIGKTFPIAQLGFYTKAKGYKAMVTEQPSRAIGIVSFPVFSQLQQDKVALKNSMRKFSQHLLFFIAPICALMIVIASPLFLILLTEKWLPMVPYFQLLLISGILYPLQLLNLQILNSKGKTKLNFRISLVKNGLRILNIFVMYRFGVLYIIYGEIIVSFLGLFINGYYTKVLVNYGVLEQLKDIFKILIFSIISALLAYLIVSLFSNPLMHILISVLVVLLVYYILNFTFNKMFLKDSLEIIQSKFLVNDKLKFNKFRT